jgi:hypothetical protein
VRDDIDQLSEWVANEKPPDAPGFVSGSVLDREASGAHALERSIHIIHFNG